MPEPIEPIEPTDPSLIVPPDRKTMVRDPVCGAAVDPAGAGAMVEHRGERYYFCSAACREVFSAEPSRYSGVV